ncbi:MAG: ABC-three component system middle component 5 [Saprospiraceae bacterium]
MLVYHPAFDLYNCIFRMLCLLNYSKDEEIHFDKLRIWDFYFAFPGEVRDIAFPSSLRKLKETAFKYKENPYEHLSDPKRVFERMKTYQLSAAKCLASYGFIDSKSLLKNKIVKTKKDVPSELIKRLNDLSIEKSNTLKLIVNEFVDLPLYGTKGLKARTGLIDFKYDPRN